MFDQSLPWANFLSSTTSELSPLRSGRFGLIIAMVCRVRKRLRSALILASDIRSVSNLTWSQREIEKIESVSELMVLQKKEM